LLIRFLDNLRSSPYVRTVGFGSVDSTAKLMTVADLDEMHYVRV
jgi:hypothetical protein